MDKVFELMDELQKTLDEVDKEFELMDELQKTLDEVDKEFELMDELQKTLDEVDKELGDLQFKLNEALEENQMLRDNEDYEEPMDRSDFI